jgi:MATE family multidrug resistance protein
MGPFQVVNISSGYLSKSDLAAFSIVAQIYGIMYALTTGISCGVSYYVGKSIGCGSGSLAKRYARAGGALILPVTLFNGAILIAFRHPLARLFTNNEDVVHVAGLCTYVAAALHVCDAQQINFEFVLKGCGRQHHGLAIVTMCCVFGIPLSWLLAFKVGWGAPGLFAGLAIAAAVSLPLFYYVLQSYDWLDIAPVETSSPVRPAMPATPVGGDVELRHRHVTSTTSAK